MDWVRLVTEIDMNNQKVKESNPPSFRPAEVCGPPGRRFMALNRLFEGADLKLWVGLTPLA